MQAIPGPWSELTRNTLRTLEEKEIGKHIEWTDTRARDFQMVASAIYLLPYAVNIQALSLIGIFAPNALSVVPAGRESATLRVPFPALELVRLSQSAFSDT